MNIFERVLALAEERSVSKVTLRKSCDIPQSTWGTWAKANPSSIPSEYVVSIARYFNITTDELLTGEKPRLDLSDVQRRLIDGFDKLDWDGQQIVLAALVTELRRMEGEKDGEPKA